MMAIYDIYGCVKKTLGFQIVWSFSSLNHLGVVGGLTREWYQLLSRVIFDKGALLFTTVGNQSTFQPNPNLVFQT